jgi:hypothetical protein
MDERKVYKEEEFKKVLNQMKTGTVNKKGK